MVGNERSNGNGQTATATDVVNHAGKTSIKTRSAYRVVLSLAVFALGLRLLWASFVATTVENEGSYYARLGANIAHGRGYVGMREHGLQLLYPPFFPLAIAAQNFAGVPAEIAGRLVSIAAGTSFVIVAFLLAKRLYGTRVGYFAAIIAAVHPLLIAFGAAVLTESTYLAFAWAGVYFVLCARNEERTKSAAFAGMLFGFAYLTRPEGVLLPCIGAVWLVLFAQGERWKATRRALVLLVAFGVLATPYMVFLRIETGQIRLEAKTPEGRLFSKWVAQGASLDEIYRGLDPDQTERGLSVASNLAVIQTAHLTPREILVPMVLSAKSNIPRFLSELGGGLYFGNPLMFALAMLGLFGTAWNRERIAHEALIIAVSSCVVLALVSWPFWHERFEFPLCAALVLWGANGLIVFWEWTVLSLRSAGVPDARASRLAGAGLAVMVSMIIALSAVGVRKLDEVSQGWRGLAPAKEVGVWLRTLSPPPRRVVDVEPTTAFYAGAASTTFPHCDVSVALRYFERLGVDTIILRTNEVQEPWIAEWIQKGIPDPRAKLVAKIPTADGSTLIVYRFGITVKQTDAASSQ